MNPATRLTSGGVFTGSPALGRHLLLMDQVPTTNCSTEAFQFFSKSLRGQIWRLNALLVVNAILMVVMVGIGAYGYRYRHHPVTRFIFLAATTLFLPIVSYVVSTAGSQKSITADFKRGESYYVESITGGCYQNPHIQLVLIWTALVQIVGINTTAMVASDAREGRTIGPPVVLLVQAVWTFYLGVYYNKGIDGLYGNYFAFLENAFVDTGCFVLLVFALIFAKLYLGCYAWYKAKQSLMLGRNPRLIVGYMEQLQDGSQDQNPEAPSEHIPPPLIVMGEDTVSVKKKLHGYMFECMSDEGSAETRINKNGLVTLDKVWQLDDRSLRLTTQLKDICFSFALFKLLRCRFARYTTAEAGFIKSRNFLWRMLLEDSDDERILGLIEYELSFLHDFYHSSLPISYSKSWLPTLRALISLLSISYCLIAGYFYMEEDNDDQIECRVSCRGCSGSCNSPEETSDIGGLYFDLVPVYLLLVLVVLSEVREIISYIYSNWTKVALVCCYVRHASWLQSPSVKKCVGLVLQHRCKLLRHWGDKMNQCSIMVLHPWKTSMAFLRRLVSMSDQNKKVPRAVKIVIVDALRKVYEGNQDTGMTYLPRRLYLQVGDNLLCTFNSANGIAHSMLVCHIATSIYEVKSQPHQPFSDYKTAAIHLSRYCVYLVAYHPELLPDDEEWCKSLYKAVKKDAERILPSCIAAAATPEEECQQLIELLSTRSEDEVLRNGAMLGGLLAELTEEEETVWKVLADFWSETILYVAPSDRMGEHAKAIARGGELITLLWALLAHLGIHREQDDWATPTNDDATVAV